MSERDLNMDVIMPLYGTTKATNTSLCH